MASPPPPPQKKVGKGARPEIEKRGGEEEKRAGKEKRLNKLTCCRNFGHFNPEERTKYPLSRLISDYAPESLSIKTTIGKHLLHCANCFRGLHINCRPIKVGTADLLLCFCRFFYNILRNFRACNLTYIFFNYIKNIFLFVLSRSYEIKLH